MKTVKKILMIIAIIIIIVGMFILGRYGFNYAEGYSKGLLIETAKSYIPYLSISTGIILIYLVLKYIKKGFSKVLTTSILAILGTVFFIIALIAIIRIPVSRIIFPIVLLGYISSLMLISANFEENT